MATSRLDLLLQYHAEDPSDAFTLFALATEYLKQDDEAQALLYFETLVSSKPDYVGTYYHLGKLLEKLARTDDAIATYQRGIAVAQAQRDFHARAELQSALLEAQGLGFDDD